MLQTLRAWLNGSKEYFTGVALYAQQQGCDIALLTAFKKGPTEFTKRRLQQELLAICNELKAKENVDSSDNEIQPGNRQPEPSQPRPASQKEREGTFNEALYEACKKEADKQFKETMNKRAVLFALANVDDYTINLPNKIDERAKIAIEVVQGYQLTSQLYEKADYVKKYGRLPDVGEEQEANEYDHLPDHLVKQTLDNLRKNYNKMKQREQTPERVVLLQKHQGNIKKLETRWQQLKA